MAINQTIPVQYCFPMDFQDYQECLVHYGDISVLYYQFNTFEAQSTIVVADGCADFQFCCDEVNFSSKIWGSVTTSQVIGFKKNKTYCGIRLSTCSSRRLSFISYNEVVSHGVELNETKVFDDTFSEKLTYAAGFKERLILMQNWLFFSNILGPFDIDQTDYCVNKIIQSKGTIKISDLSKELNVCERKIRDDFRNNVGFTPKKFSRIVRFQDLIKFLVEPKTAHPDSINDLVTLSYYDESHLAKEVKYFTRATPKTIMTELLMLKMNSETTNHSSLGEIIV